MAAKGGKGRNREPNRCARTSTRWSAWAPLLPTVVLHRCKTIRVLMHVADGARGGTAAMGVNTACKSAPSAECPMVLSLKRICS